MTRLLTTLGLSAGLVLLLTLPVAGESVRQPVLAAIIQYRVQEPDRVGVDADDRPGNGRKALREQSVTTTDIEHITVMLRGQRDQPRVVGGVVVPVVGHALLSEATVPR